MVRGENFLKAVGKTIRKTVKFFSCNIRPKDEEDEDVPRRLRRRKKTQSTHFEEEVVEDIAALSADVHPPLFKELTTDIDPSLLEELTADVHPPLFEELTADIDPSLLEELTADVHPPLFEELTADIDPSLLEELTADVYPPLLDKLTMNVHQSPSRELTAEVQQFPLQGLTAGVHPSLSQIVVIAQVHRAFSDSPVPEEAKDEEEEDNEGCRSVVQKEQLAKDIAEEKPAILWDLDNDIWRVEDECRPHSASCRSLKLVSTEKEGALQRNGTNKIHSLRGSYDCATDDEKHREKKEHLPQSSLGRFPEPPSPCTEEEDITPRIGSTKMRPFSATKDWAAHNEKRRAAKEEFRPQSAFARLQDPPSPCTEEEEGAFLKFGINQINLNPKKTSLHHLCERFGHLGPLAAEKLADTVAENHLELLLNHYLESPLSACEKMMRGVFFSSLCSLEHALFFFVHTVNDSSQKARQKEDYIVRKAKALKALGLLVMDVVDDKTLKIWMSLVSNTLLYAVVLFGSRLHDEDRRKLKDHMSMEQLIDIIKVLLARSMPEMSSVIQPMLDGAQCGMLYQRSGCNKAPTDL